MCRNGNEQDWIRELDVSPSTRRWVVEVYVPQGPHQGAPVVFGYTYVHATTIHLIYIGTPAYKYIGHETANWLGYGGRRSTHCWRLGRGSSGLCFSQ